ncbi:tail protein X [Helicobacter pullorum]|uniref:tail protein X n=1 Tax=Helicobacter pullorum TaxID=35818 RepID=UPI00255CCE2C|nr:tail protein X [Helicobacter pullorum]
MSLTEFLEQKASLEVEINTLKNKLADIENTPEVTETQIGKNGVLAKKYLEQYPIFTQNTGASGTKDTGRLYCFSSLSGAKVYIQSGASNYALTGRTTIAREYTNSGGVLATTTPNYPGVSMSASNSFFGHFVGTGANYTAFVDEYKTSRLISEVVKLQEDRLDELGGTARSKYARSDFEDLESCEFSYESAITIYEALIVELTTNLNQELTTKTEQLTSIIEQIAGLQEQARTELEKSQTELTKKQEELSQKEAENEAVLKEIESLKAQESELQEQIKQLEEQIANAGSADNEELESLKQSIAELESAKIQKEQELQNANANLESLKAKKAELESQIAELEAQAQELQEQINLHNQEIPKLETRKDYAELKIPENEALLEQKKQEYKELAEAINALNREIKALSDEIKAKEAEITELKSQKTGLEEQIQENNSKYEALRVELESLQQEILALQNKLENAGTDTIKTLENLHRELLGIAEELGVTLCATLDDKEEEEEKPQIPTTEIVIPKDFKGFHYIAKDDERLDSIVYSHYGTLNVFQSVLETNSHLLNKKILNAGDIVLLPKINTSIKTLDDLWN